MTKNKSTATVAVEVHTEAIKLHLEQRLADAVEAQFESTIADMIRDRVAELIDDVSRDFIRKAVTDAVNDGWQQTNSYGEAYGPKVGLKGRIAEMLSKQEGDYNRRESRVEKIAREVLEQSLHAEFGKELSAARERFKAQVNEVVAAKFTETIKAALGLR